jgi:hypothetical protein
MNTKSQFQRLKDDSKLVMKALQQEALAQKFLIGSHNAVRLRRSLAAGQRQDLIDRTLLTPEVHKVHAKRLSDRYLKQWTKKRDQATRNWQKLPPSLRMANAKPTEHDIAAAQYRFLTVVDSVTAVDAGDALRAVIKLKEKLTTTASSVRGIFVLGVLEVEVVSMRLMREFRRLDQSSDSEYRKLDVCETLTQNLKGSLYAQDDSFFLVHFHGVVTAKTPEQFEQFYERLRKVKAWNAAPRQLEMKALSKAYSGRSKSMEQNLKHIATYITKGGNDWYANKAYLRYKIGFENDDAQVNDEATWVAKNWRRSAILRQEHSEGGIVDLLSMTAEEILQLAVVIDGLMGLNRTRTGYLVSVGK